MTSLSEVNKERRIRQLENLHNELHYIATYYLPALFKETQKGIDLVEKNGDFFFPAKNYMEEKIEGIKSSIEYIEKMLNADSDLE